MDPNNPADEWNGSTPGLPPEDRENGEAEASASAHSLDLDEIKRLLETDASETEAEHVKAPVTGFRRELFDWAQALVTSIIFVGFLFIFIGRVIGVEGYSMENTLMDTEKILISNLFYEPQPGDIIVFTKHNVRLNEILPYDASTNSDRPFVKRVIAIEGQTVDIDFSTGTVTVDGVVKVEPYIKNSTTSDEGNDFPLVVPEGHVFVMGDNRGDSLDSRSPRVGTIDKRYILGRVLLRLWPLDKLGSVS